MKKVIRFLRADEWLTSKVTLMTGVLLFFSYINATGVDRVIREMIAFFLFVSMFLAVSYVANDLSDIEVDKKAGKQKVIAELPGWMVFFSFFIMIIIGNIPIILISINKKHSIILIVVTYILGLAYSTLGLRFKEKGAVGLIECSFAQRCKPLFLVACLEEVKGISNIYLTGWIVISFLDGLRYILIHQILDMDNDIKSGVKTFITQKRKNFRNIIRTFLVTEVLILCGVFTPLWGDMPVFMICIISIYVLFELCIYIVLNIYAGKDWLVTFDSVPLEAFLNVVFPTAMGIFMVRTAGWQMLVYCVLVVMLCLKSLTVKMNIVAIFIRSKMGNVKDKRYN